MGATAGQVASNGVNDRQDFGGGFFWAGGGVPTTDATSGSVGMVFSAPSSYFGMHLICLKSSCTAPAQLTVGAFDLYVRETVGPTFAAPIGLWQSQGWVRGTWRFFAWGDSPSGLCALSASLNGQLVNAVLATRDVSSWHQCAAPPIDQQVDTSRYGAGALPLIVGAVDAAGVPANVSRSVYVDNSTPSVTLSGPTDVPSTAGTPYITALAGGSPSGIADVICSVDGGAARSYPGASARVPVSGIGSHVVSCFAQNNAVDPSGAHGQSATASWSVKIGQPTLLGIAFDKLVGLRCARVKARVRVPGRWVTVRRHGKRVKIKTRAHFRVVRVERCHPRLVRRRTVVFVPVRRHGHLVKVKRVKVVEVAVPPRIVAQSSRVVAFGHATTVNGWLGTSTGTALAARAVLVLTAPDNGSGQFSEVAVVRTAATGAWNATLPAGPSRIVEAVYGGDPTTESAWSGHAREIVPAKVRLLSVSPRRVAWGGTVRITGQLLGGYLPPGGALVRLRIGQGSTYQTYGVQEHVTGNGRFTTTYTFGAGQASVYQSFWFQIASLPMGSYPFAPAGSGRRSVLVGGHPATRHRHH